MSSTNSPAQDGATVTNIQVGGNVAGDIIAGNYNFKVNTNNGTIIYNAPHEPVIKRRDKHPRSPRAPLDFFDRTNELTQIEEFIAQGKAVTICGAEGIGKSALLRQAANSNIAHTLPDGVLLLEGQDERGCTLQTEDVIQRMFDAFYFTEPQLKVNATTAQPYLSELHPLLLLDHAGLEATGISTLLDLVSASPTLIARTHTLPGLASSIKLGPLPHDDAMSLFAAASGLPLDKTTRPGIDEMCAMLNDVPLAIVRAADVTCQMNLTLAQASQRLSAAPPTTGDVISIGLGRLQALMQSVLTPLERQVLGIVANLPGFSIDVPTVVFISGATTRDIQAAIDHLKALGMLRANSPRVSLDPGLRDFWRPAGDENLVRDRLLAHFLADWRAGRFDDDAYCAAELGQVLGTLEWAVQRNHWEDVLSLGHAIDRYLTLHGLWDAWGQVVNWVLQAARASNNQSGEAWALHQLGTRVVSVDRAQAIDLLQQALHLRLSNGDLAAAAFTRHNLDILIPPPPPPSGTEPAPVAPTGMSVALKTIVAMIVTVVIVGGGYLVLAPAGLRLPPEISVEAAGPQGTAVTFEAAAAEPTGGNLPISCQPSSGSMFMIGQTTVTCSASNRNGQVTSASFTVTVRHAAPPLITVPQTITLEAVSSAGAMADYSVAANDAVDGPVNADCDHPSGSTFTLGLTTITCTGIDTQGNVGRGSFEVRVQDTTPPKIEVPSDMLLEAASSAGAVGIYEVISSDLVDRPSVTCDYPAGSTFALGRTNVTCTASDASNNINRASFVIEVQHIAPPIVMLPADMRIEANSQAGALAVYDVNYTDQVDSATIACDHLSGSAFPLGETKVVCTATDAHNNVGRGSFIVEVQHTVAPALILPADIITEATRRAGAVVEYTVSVKDTVDTATVTCTPRSGSIFAPGSTTVTCTALDTHKNIGRGTFYVNVKHTPNVILPPNMTLEATSPAGAVGRFFVSSQDAVDRAVNSCAPSSGSTFPLGKTSVTCITTDTQGYVGRGSFLVNVLDTKAPTLLLPGNMTAEATSLKGAVVGYTVSAEDIVGVASLTCDPPSGSTFAPNLTTVECQAVDKYYNVARGTFRIDVRHTPTPTVPTDITREATGSTGATATFDVGYIDLVDTAMVNCVPRSGSTFQPGRTTVTCTATDMRNSVGRRNFLITVTHTIAPVLVLTSVVTAEATSSSGANVYYQASAKDTVDRATVVCIPRSGLTFPLGETKVNCTATDTYRNAIQGSFVVKVMHTKPPIVMVPPDITADATSQSGAKVSYSAPAQDVVDSASVTCYPPSGSIFAMGTTTVTCTATDTYHNTGSRAFRVNVKHTPSLVVPSDMTLEATGPTGATGTFAVYYTDLMDTATVTCVPSSGSTFPLGKTTVNCTATDTQSSVGQRSFQINVQHTVPPVLSLPGDMTLEATHPWGAYATYSPSAKDSVDRASVTCTPDSGAQFQMGTTSVSCKATDAHRNQSSGTFRITVRDITPPSVMDYSDRTARRYGTECSNKYSKWTIVATASDKRGIQSVKVIYSYALTNGTVKSPQLTANMPIVLGSEVNGFYSVIHDIAGEASVYLLGAQGKILYKIVAKDYSNLEAATPANSIPIENWCLY